MIHIYAHTYLHIHTYTYIYIYIHTYTHKGTASIKALIPGSMLQNGTSYTFILTLTNVLMRSDSAKVTVTVTDLPSSLNAPSPRISGFSGDTIYTRDQPLHFEAVTDFDNCGQMSFGNGVEVQYRWRLYQGTLHVDGMHR